MQSYGNQMYSMFFYRYTAYFFLSVDFFYFLLISPEFLWYIFSLHFLYIIVANYIYFYVFTVISQIKTTYCLKSSLSNRIPPVFYFANFDISYKYNFF